MKARNPMVNLKKEVVGDCCIFFPLYPLLPLPPSFSPFQCEEFECNDDDTDDYEY